MSDTALAVISRDHFVALRDGDIPEMMETIQENLGGKPLTLKVLKNVKMPAGGATVWQVPTAAGDVNTNVLRGIIVLQNERRVFWSKSLDQSRADNNGQAQRPDCFSPDGISGYGFRDDRDRATNDQHHKCAECPLAQWREGSGGERIKPRCNLRRQVFILQEQDMLPLVLDLPPTSLSPFDAYLNMLTGDVRRYSHVVTEIGLTKATQGNQRGGQAYSQCTFTMSGLVPKELRADIQQYTDAMRAIVNKPVVIGSTVETGAPVDEMEEIEL